MTHKASFTLCLVPPSKVPIIPLSSSAKSHPGHLSDSKAYNFLSLSHSQIQTVDDTLGFKHTHAHTRTHTHTHTYQDTFLFSCVTEMWEHIAKTAIHLLLHQYYCPDLASPRFQKLKKKSFYELFCKGRKFALTHPKIFLLSNSLIKFIYAEIIPGPNGGILV